MPNLRPSERGMMRHDFAPTEQRKRKDVKLGLTIDEEEAPRAVEWAERSRS